VLDKIAKITFPDFFFPIDEEIFRSDLSFVTLTALCPFMNCKNYISGLFSALGDDNQLNFDVHLPSVQPQTKFGIRYAWPTLELIMPFDELKTLSFLYFFPLDDDIQWKFDMQLCTCIG
jgi:hypothetical protein